MPVGGSLLFLFIDNPRSYFTRVPITFLSKTSPVVMSDDDSSLSRKSATLFGMKHC